MAVIPVNIAGHPYEVRVEAGLLGNVAAECAPLLRKKCVPIITDSNVHAAWGGVVEASLVAAGYEPRWRILPPGEASKGWSELAATLDWLLAEEVERGDHILALGGGVIGDLTGFAVPSSNAAAASSSCLPRCWRRLIPALAARLRSTPARAKISSAHSTSPH